MPGKNRCNYPHYHGNNIRDGIFRHHRLVVGLIIFPKATIFVFKIFSPVLHNLFPGLINPGWWTITGKIVTPVRP